MGGAMPPGGGMGGMLGSKGRRANGGHGWSQGGGGGLSSGGGPRNTGIWAGVGAGTGLQVTNGPKWCPLGGSTGHYCCIWGFCTSPKLLVLKAAVGFPAEAQFNPPKNLWTQQKQPRKQLMLKSQLL